MSERTETFLYILLLIQILTLIVLFLVVQQVNKAVIEIKKFCWANKLVDDATGSGQPNIRIV